MPTRVFLSVSGTVLLAALVVVTTSRWRSGKEPEPPPSLPAPREQRPAEQRPARDGFLGVIIPEEAVDISTRVEGRLESVKVRVGDTVRQGAVLAVLDTQRLRRDLAIAEAEVLTARAGLHMAELALAEAQEKLARREDPKQVGLGALSQEELSTSRYEQRMAAVKLEAAQARLLEQQARVTRIQQDILEATPRAPFDGVVASRLADPGALVRSGQNILHLLRTGVRRVRFAVPEQEIRTVSVGLPVHILASGQEPPLSGRVSSLTPEVDVASGMMLGIAELEESGERPPPPSGSAVRVFIQQGGHLEEPTAQRVRNTK